MTIRPIPLNKGRGLLFIGNWSRLQQSAQSKSVYGRRGVSIGNSSQLLKLAGVLSFDGVLQFDHDVTHVGRVIAGQFGYDLSQLRTANQIEKRAQQIAFVVRAG
jgi:hypothetical protein